MDITEPRSDWPTPQWLSLIDRWDRFMIVDDNRFDGLICQKLIHNACGQDALLFDDGTAAYDYLCSARFKAKRALLFLDINMKRMDGFEMMALLAERGHMSALEQRLRVVFITSTTRDHDVRLALQLPICVGFLQKPLLIQKTNYLFSAFNA